MDGWMDAWMHAWMDGWIHGWMYGGVDRRMGWCAIQQGLGLLCGSVCNDYDGSTASGKRCDSDGGNVLRPHQVFRVLACQTGSGHNHCTQVTDGAI
eukprot:363930-Chlamydomonas_euryale.AAC.11